MPEFENEFADKPSPPNRGEVEERLAGYVATVAWPFGIHFTDSERDGLAKVIGAVLRAHPWILDIPGVHAPSGHVEAPVTTDQ